MHRGVHAHAGVAFAPVDCGGHRVAGIEGRGAGRGNMRDLAFGRVDVNRIVDRDARAVCRGERAEVAGLAAGIGVEHGAVEHDAALLGDRGHARVALLAIALVAEQAIRGHRALTSSRTELKPRSGAPAIPAREDFSRAEIPD